MHHRVQPHYGVRTERYKLIYFDRIDRWELYDLRRDPRELRNLYADPAYAGTARALKAELYRLKKELKDDDRFEKELPRDDVDTSAP
jgi:arylsulfatase A-like enzyme